MFLSNKKSIIFVFSKVAKMFLMTPPPTKKKPHHFTLKLLLFKIQNNEKLSLIFLKGHWVNWVI